MAYKHGLCEVKYQYGLHDTEISRITRMDCGLVLEFDGGVYALNDAGNETERTKKCYLTLKINDFDRTKPYEHVEIRLISGGKIREIGYDEFERTSAKNAITVSLDYYCPFADSILLKGYMSQGEIELTVTEIAELSFAFEG